jgi:hypothetical protein
LAAAVGNRTVAKELQTAFIALPHNEARGGRPAYDALDTQIASILTAIKGDACVGFFEKAAGDPQLGQSTRLAALLALGRLHSEKSAAAFARLRDAAYGLPGAPERRASYTHAERIQESAIMTLYFLPGGYDESMIPKTGRNNAWGVSVDENYRTGNLWLNNMQIKLLRVGSEWLVSSAVPGPVS